MQLEKWYCDVVDNEHVDIHYGASLRLGRAVLGYRGRLSSAGRQESAYFQGSAKLPTQRENALHWPLPVGELLFPQCELPPGPELTLWERPAQRMTWQPVVLSSRVQGAEYSPEARGYAEVLRLNFGPWTLGLRRLLWGRFCGPGHSFVWIVWEGASARRIALLNGQPVMLRSTSPSEVDAHGASLKFLYPRLIVSERMDNGALKGLPLPGPLSKLKFMQGLETKWHCPTELCLANNTVRGHAVFEEVLWE
jgi:hypothetical protein